MRLDEFIKLLNNTQQRAFRGIHQNYYFLTLEEFIKTTIFLTLEEFIKTTIFRQ